MPALNNWRTLFKLLVTGGSQKNVLKNHVCVLACLLPHRLVCWCTCTCMRASIRNVKKVNHELKGDWLHACRTRGNMMICLYELDYAFCVWQSRQFIKTLIYDFSSGKRRCSPTTWTRWTTRGRSCRASWTSTPPPPSQTTSPGGCSSSSNDEREGCLGTIRHPKSKAQE